MSFGVAHSACFPCVGSLDLTLGMTLSVRLSRWVTRALPKVSLGLSFSK